MPPVAKFLQQFKPVLLLAAVGWLLCFFSGSGIYQAPQKAPSQKNSEKKLRVVFFPFQEEMGHTRA